MVLRVFVFLTMVMLGATTAYARHRCPKVPAPPGMFGFSSSTTLIPSGTTMAAARSSQTSGCENGHPSGEFYVPQRARVTLFLQDNLQNVQEEATQGHGQYLSALAAIAGCSSNPTVFEKEIRIHYRKIFLQQDEPTQSLQFNQVENVTDEILNLLQKPHILTSCSIGKTPSKNLQSNILIF